jgi:hypothetical protein
MIPVYFYAQYFFPLQRQGLLDKHVTAIPLTYILVCGWEGDGMDLDSEVSEVILGLGLVFI